MKLTTCTVSVIVTLKPPPFSVTLSDFFVPRIALVPSQTQTFGQIKLALKYYIDNLHHCLNCLALNLRHDLGIPDTMITVVNFNL